MTIYERIDGILKERGISRRQLARMAGIKETTLASVFAKHPDTFPPKYLGPIAAALGVSVDDLDTKNEEDAGGICIRVENVHYSGFFFVFGNEAEKLKNATEEEKQAYALMKIKSQVKKNIDEMDADKFYRLLHMLISMSDKSVPVSSAASSNETPEDNKP